MNAELWSDGATKERFIAIPGDGKIELPVKLKVHDSIFVPLAKWAMLLTGNYRCVQKDAARSIKEAVHTDIEASRSVYNWVVELCVKLGASRDDLVSARGADLRSCREDGHPRGGLADRA